MPDMPDDLRRAYETFTLLCTNHGVSFAGMAISLDPPGAYALGNCKERGHDLARLFHLYADLIDQKVNDGLVETPQDRPIDKIRIN
jgi:hypothetical protein